MKDCKDNIKNIVMIICILMMCFLGGYIIYHKDNAMHPDDTRIISDTILVTKVDTIKIDSIIYKERTKIDSIYIHDTVLIREQIHYQDSIIDLYISGIEPEIDSLKYFIKKDSIIINNDIERIIIKNKKIGLVWNVGLYAGYGFQFNNGQYGQGFEVGIGASIGIGGMIK